MKNKKLKKIIKQTKQAVYLAGFNQAKRELAYKDMMDIIELEIALKKSKKYE